MLWFSFASMASSWTSSPDDGCLYAPAARVGEIPREPPEGAEDRSQGYVRRHLARKGASAVPTCLRTTLCGLPNDLHEA